MPNNKDIFGVQRDKTRVERPPVGQSAELSTEQMGEPAGPRLRMTLNKSMRKTRSRDMFGLASESAEESVGRSVSDVGRVPADEQMPQNEVKSPKEEEE